MKNPNTGRDNGTIARVMYEPVCQAILGALADTPDGILFGDLRRHVEARTPPELWKDASIGWYTTTVKLHIEAEGWLERSGSPQRLHLTDAGRSQRATD